MKKWLLPENGSFYKANLHCHSTVSDGKLSPQEIKELYMQNGYSVVAYTDHDIFLHHPELKDENFLPLNGYEIEVTEGGSTPWILKKTCHLCLVALEESTKKQVCWHREKYMIGNGAAYRDQVVFDESLPDYNRSYTPECINDIIRQGRENGFFVTLNHPIWSREEVPTLLSYEGMNAMEIYNNGCYVHGYEDYVPWLYDLMAASGKQLYCIAADDNHNGAPFGSIHCDACGGFVMIKADKLEYRAITRALENGEFYASRGPLINALWYEDGKVRIETSDAVHIHLTAPIRRGRYKAAEKGKVINFAEFELLPEDTYFRITVFDAEGRTADTNMYYVKDIIK